MIYGGNFLFRTWVYTRELEACGFFYTYIVELPIFFVLSIRQFFFLE